MIRLSPATGKHGYLRNGGTFSSGRSSRTWARRFFKRHGDVLSSRFVDHLDPLRAKVPESAVVKDFNDQLKAVFEKYPNLPPSNIYATQMTWLQPLSKKTQVWAMRGAMRSHAKGNECRFSLTCLLTAFADNTYLDPFFIVKGKTCSPDWVSDPLMVASLRLAGSIHPGHRPKKARTESFTQWAELVFMPMTTARRSAETPMMLLMDNHGSHRTISSGYATETSR